MTSGVIFKAEKLWAKGVLIREIAEECGVNISTLTNYAAAHRDRFPARRKSPRLTDQQKDDILRLHKEFGMGPYAVARRVGCSENSARRYIRMEVGE